MWQKLVEKLRENTKEGRNISYHEGGIGITALLQCPLKHDLYKIYQIQPQAVEVDDGFLWEKQVKSALKELFPQTQEEKDLIIDFHGYLIHGHLDIFIEHHDSITAIELKAPKFVQLRKMPQSVEGGLFIDTENIVLHNPTYLKQAQIQKFILERLYPDKRINQYLFYKALARYRNFNMKLYIVSPITESIQEQELLELLKDFHSKKSPKYPNECEYCIFYKEGLCPGEEYQESKQEKIDLFLDYLREYRRLQGELKTVESYLKKLIKGSVRLNGKEIGWIKKEVKELDIRKLIELLDNPEDYLTVKWNKKEQLIERFGERIIKERKNTLEWKL